MRRLTFLWVVALAALACAEPARADSIHSAMFELDFSTNGTVRGLTITNNAIQGWIEEIYTDAPISGATGTVLVTYQPILSSMALVNVYTNPLCFSDVTVRPRVDTTGPNGVALTSDPPTRFALSGETLYVTITNQSASTNCVWRLILKYESK